MLLLARGIFLGSRPQKPERDAKRRPVGWTRTEQTPRGQQPPEQEREAESAKRSEEREWWSVLKVSPYASTDEIRRSYLRKMKQSHPDRVLSLAPELLSLAEGQAKALNAAYAAAIRCGKQSRKFG